MPELAEPEIGIARRPTMRDGMVLVAAVAIGVGVARALLAQKLSLTSVWPYVVFADIATCIALTPTLLVLSLFQPRPTLADLCRRPGFVASLAGSTVITLGLATAALLGTIRQVWGLGPFQLSLSAPGSNSLWWLAILGYFNGFVGPAVIACWVMLAMGGRLRPTNGWLEYGELTIGALWIVLFVIECHLHLDYLIR